MTTSSQERVLMAKIRQLPSKCITEVEDFVDFLRQRHTKPNKPNRTFELPVDSVGSYRQDISFRREDMYSDDGR